MTTTSSSVGLDSGTIPGPWLARTAFLAAETTTVRLAHIRAWSAALRYELTSRHPGSPDRARHPAGSSFCSDGQGRYELDCFIDAGEGKLCGFVDGPDEIAVVCLEQAETARLARYQHASDIANSRAVSAKPASTLNHSVLRNAELLHR